jgi:hypothetical protein
VTTQVLHHLNKNANIYIYIYIYILIHVFSGISKGEVKKGERRRLSSMDRHQSLTLLASVSR